jgi:uncharacterized protein (DUF1778 family)
MSAYFAVMKIFDAVSKLVSDKVNSQCFYSRKIIMEIVMKTYVSPQEQGDSNISRMTTRVDKSVYDVVARAAKNGGLSISKYMEQAILKQALVDIYFEDISLLSLKSEEELAWLQTKLASKFSDNTVLMQKLEQLEGKKNNAGITYKSTRRKLFA